MTKYGFLIMKIFFLCLIVISCAVPVLASPPAGSGYSWKIIFEDNFDGTSLNTSKWLSQLPWTRDYKGDAYMRDENVTVNNGLLTITAKAESYSGHSFTSGAISTGYSKFRYKYGYAEARLKLPGARGSWSNFWMLTDGWPPEFDVVEYPLDSVSGSNNQRYRYFTNIHYGTSSSNMGTHWTSDLSGGFHTYALDWRPWYVAYYLDNSYVRSLNDFQPSNDFGSMYMIFDYYVGGDWGGEVLQHPDPATWPAATSSAVQYQIDWVRVWQRNQDTVKECIGRWTLDEAAGTIAADSSGKGKNGTLTGGMTFAANRVNGNLGTAVSFDGVDDYIDLPDGFDEFDNGFTVTLWAKPTAVKNYARFIELGNGESSDNIYLSREAATNGLRFKAYGGSSSDGAVIATNAIELDRWQFLAATIDTSGNVTLYKNGAAIKTGTSTWPWGLTRTQNYLGKSNWAADEYYQGALDEVRVYDYAMTAAEIQSVFTSTAHCMNVYPEYLDVNWDCVVDFSDLAKMLEYWLADGLYRQ
jgi:beta-glucanase (GH16 family)